MTAIKLTEARHCIWEALHTCVIDEDARRLLRQAMRLMAPQARTAARQRKAPAVSQQRTGTLRGASAPSSDREN